MFRAALRANRQGVSSLPRHIPTFPHINTTNTQPQTLIIPQRLISTQNSTTNGYISMTNKNKTTHQSSSCFIKQQHHHSPNKNNHLFTQSNRPFGTKNKSSCPTHSCPPLPSLSELASQPKKNLSTKTKVGIGVAAVLSCFALLSLLPNDHILSNAEHFGEWEQERNQKIRQFFDSVGLQVQDAPIKGEYPSITLNLSAPSSLQSKQQCRNELDSVIMTVKLTEDLVLAKLHSLESSIPPHLLPIYTPDLNAFKTIIMTGSPFAGSTTAAKTFNKSLFPSKNQFESNFERHLNDLQQLSNPDPTHTKQRALPLPAQWCLVAHFVLALNTVMDDLGIYINNRLLIEHSINNTSFQQTFLSSQSTSDPASAVTFDLASTSDPTTTPASDPTSVATFDLFSSDLLQLGQISPDYIAFAFDSLFTTATKNLQNINQYQPLVCILPSGSIDLVQTPDDDMVIDPYYVNKINQLYSLIDSINTTTSALISTNVSKEASQLRTQLISKWKQNLIFQQDNRWATNGQTNHSIVFLPSIPTVPIEIVCQPDYQNSPEFQNKISLIDQGISELTEGLCTLNQLNPHPTPQPPAPTPTPTEPPTEPINCTVHGEKDNKQAPARITFKRTQHHGDKNAV